MKKMIFCFAVLFVAIFNLNAQDSTNKENFAIHPKFSIGPVFHFSNFSFLNEKVECGTFDKGSGLGIWAGVGFELPITQSILLDLGISYFSNSADFTIEDARLGYDAANNNSILVETENKIEASLGYLIFSPGIRTTLLKDFINGPLVLTLGLNAAIPVNKSFTQTESITNPQNAYFLKKDGSKTRTLDLVDGDIEGTNGLLFGAYAGIENQLKLSDKLAFTQQLSIDYDMTNIISYDNWKYFDIKLSLGLRYSFRDEPKPVPPPPAPEPVKIVPVEKPKPTLVYRIDKIEGQKLSTGNELIATQPLLNTVFFSQNSADVPSFYVKTKPELNDLNKMNPVLAHKYALVRIAELIKSKPNSKITLEGATSGSTNEPEGISLAQKRAENLKQYFIELGVNPSQIDAKWNIAPKNPTNQEYKEGIEENQRVDIILKNALLQEYVSKQNYAELSGTLSYAVSMNNFENNTNANLYFDFIDTNIVIKKSGAYTVKFEKRIDENIKNVTIGSRINAGELKAEDSRSIDINTIKKEVVELDYANFKAILRFDYNSNKLTDENKELLSQLVNILPNGSTIKILGSADALGSDQSNQKLEADRAVNTENFIKSLGKGIKITTGSNPNKFDNNSPIGRFLNRSIIITIE